MISKTQLVIVFILMLPFYSNGQTRIKFIGLEAGGDFIACASNKKDYIRGDAPMYNTYGYGAVIRNEMHKIFSGVKAEVRTVNDKFGFLTGLRFTQINSVVSKKTDPDYFYLLLQQTATTTEYLRVKELQQTSRYIGIPIEIRLAPFKVRRIRFYFMCGAEISYQLTTKNNIVLKDPSMEMYQAPISKIIGTPDKLYGTFYGGAGFTLGKEFKPRINLEISPLVISSGTSSITSPVVGVGFHLHTQIPI